MLTPKVLSFLASEEGLILEAYKDSVGVWTWALGVTNASGHMVDRYKDHPQSVDRCVEVSVWLIKEKYLPTVLKAFPGGLTDTQLAAALSFHWNTGAISKADWVKQFNKGDVAKSRQSIMNWGSGGLLKSRRHREQALFFDGVYPGNLLCPIYPVRKPSYSPDFSHRTLVDLTEQFGKYT